MSWLRLLSFRFLYGFLGLSGLGSLLDSAICFFFGFHDLTHSEPVLGPYLGFFFGFYLVVIGLGLIWFVLGKPRKIIAHFRYAEGRLMCSTIFPRSLAIDLAEIGTVKICEGRCPHAIIYLRNKKKLLLYYDWILTARQLAGHLVMDCENKAPRN